MKLNLYAVAYPVRALGPGLRVAVWVSGCTRSCPGCISPEMQPWESGRPIETGTLLRRILNLALPLTGLTISGGEPLDQADALGEMIRGLRRARPAWDVILYSGYTREEIAGGELEKRTLLELTDVLIDGPFRKDEPSDHPLKGSGNQKIWALSARGAAMLEESRGSVDGSFDLGLGPGDLSLVVGVGTQERRSAVYRGLGVTGGREYILKERRP